MAQAVRELPRETLKSIGLAKLNRCFICRSAVLKSEYQFSHRRWCPVIAKDRIVEMTLDRRGLVIREKEPSVR